MQTCINEVTIAKKRGYCVAAMNAAQQYRANDLAASLLEFLQLNASNECAVVPECWANGHVTTLH